MKEIRTRFLSTLRGKLVDPFARKGVLFQGVFLILTVVSGVMTVVNKATGKQALMVATLLFAVLCLINFVLGQTGRKRGQRIARWLLLLELIALFTWFLVSGEPEGFAAIWICLLPAFSFLLYAYGEAAITTVCVLAELIFFLWIPFGRSLLRYRYTDSFMLRYPLLFAASGLLAAILGWIVALTDQELKRKSDGYAYLSDHDPLTGLFNRYGFRNALAFAPEEKPVAVCMMDLDRFKAINDTLGHMHGDIVLKAVAEILKSYTSDCLIPARWGGEEFLLVAFGVTDPRALAEEICDRVRREEISMPTGGIAHITISIGVSTADSLKQSNIEELIRLADEKMYTAKENGRDRVEM